MIDYADLVDVGQLRRDHDDNGHAFIFEYAAEAKDFLCKKRWCKGIVNVFYGDGCEGIIAIFLVEIVPESADVDKLLWVVVGDVPPAYLVTDVIERPLEALKVYIEEMRAWVDAVKAGKAVENIIPVNAPPTKEYADMLAVRLDFLRDNFLAE